MICEIPHQIPKLDNTLNPIPNLDTELKPLYKRQVPKAKFESATIELRGSEAKIRDLDEQLALLRSALDTHRHRVRVSLHCGEQRCTALHVRAYIYLQ